MRNRDAEALQRQVLGQGEKILQLQRTYQERQIDPIDSAGLKRTVMHCWGDGVAHRVGNDTE